VAKNNTPAQQENGFKLWLENSREYISSVYNELKKVHWPGRPQLIAYTGVVLFSIALVSLIIWLFDSGLSFLLTKLMDAFA